MSKRNKVRIRKAYRKANKVMKRLGEGASYAIKH